MAFGSLIKVLYRKLMYRQKASSEEYVRWLRKRGVSIGEGTRFFDPVGTEVDVTQPSLIHIGKDVMITQNVIILSHGFDWFVLNGVYGDVLGSAGKVTIGDNVFIGSKSIILKGVTIGDNCIIGAGSLVNKDVPQNTVAAGNPVRVISSLSDYYEKRKQLQLKEAVTLYASIKERGEVPEKKDFREFFWLFEETEDGRFDEPSFNYEMNIGSRFEKTYQKYRSTQRLFSGFQLFSEYCEKTILEEYSSTNV